ncbi:hypothetical protein EV175_004524 [Coemansia sp. RSA 1933]|nr:hypothetical protein EV175_004524 [Coemansia sp. RSA 1933]
MHYRMFLLPDAIDQTLEHYERYRRSQEQSNDTPAAEAEPGDEASNGDSNTSGGSSRTISSPIIESLNSVMNRIDSETQQALEAAPLEQPTDNSSTATRSSRNELIRRMRQREREEKLQRLRSMVRALSDERRFLPVPVVILGMHMSGELYHAISSGFNARVSASGSSGASGPETSTRTNSTSADAASAAAAGHEDFGGSNSSTAGASDERSGGTEGIFRGIRTRAGRLVPSIFDTIAAWRNGRGDSEATAAAAGNEDVGGGSDGSSRIPNVSSTTAAEAQQTSSSSDDGPMISAYLTIQYTQLGNPLLLHIIASTLLSDMLGETGASQSSTSASGNDYEILTELSNIIGQVMSNTVSQDLVNKKLAKYRFEGIIGGGEAGDDDNRDAGSIARLIGSEDNEKDGLQHPSTVKLLSSHRCPVCLEDFKVGETLRVLGCRHALHLACGDSWFTQGSNMCPVCRAEAVSTAPQKTN